jgi:sulfatase maturation enzyme AslB (radical SAM superfamily)
MLNNKSLEDQIQFRQREKDFMRRFFLDRVSEDSVLSGQSFMYLHYADMIANGYHRTMPCPFQGQGLLLNPEGNLFYCENSEKLGNVLDESAESLYFKVANLAHREVLKDKVCPTCLSPCQVNVGAMKQVVPYVKFLRRAYKVKHDPSRHLETIPPVR